jgi:hypothetical protein
MVVASTHMDLGLNGARQLRLDANTTVGVAAAGVMA